MTTANVIYDKEMTDTQFQKFSLYIKELCGINLTLDKKTMVESRLRKRIKQLELPTFRKYLQYIYSAEGKRNETKVVIDLISTNKTEFFREPKHFDYLKDVALPSYYKLGVGTERAMNVWCAASSSGEEPYTLAFILREFQKLYPDFEYRLICSDISTRVLQKAVKAVYDYERIEPIPIELKQKYLLRGRNENTGLFRITPEIRNSVSFFRQNLTDIRYEIEKNQDIIFCRNVLIYFDSKTKEKIVNTLAKYLNPNGIFVLGHAESLNGLDVPFTRIDSTIYKKV